MDLTKKAVLRSYGINGLLALIAFVILTVLMQTGVFSGYISNMILLICINCILAISLNLTTGILGELCLGHAGFMAVGAYSCALFVMHSGLPPALGFPLGLIIGSLVGGLVGFLVGLPALKLRGDYLAIITLGFGQIIAIILRSMKSVTGGARGLIGIPNLTNFNYVYWLMILEIFIIYALIHSRHGRAITAIRDDDIAAAAAGINVYKYKMLAFIFSAAFAGLAGGLFAHYQSILVPNKFDFNYSIDIMVMVVFGGMGSLTGSVLSATILTLTSQLLHAFSSYKILIYSVLLIIMMIFRPQGLLGNREISQQLILKYARKIKGWFRPGEPKSDDGLHNGAVRTADAVEQTDGVASADSGEKTL